MPLRALGVIMTRTLALALVTFSLPVSCLVHLRRPLAHIVQALTSTDPLEQAALLQVSEWDTSHSDEGRHCSQQHQEQL